MTDEAESAEWRFYKFHCFVTGEGEKQFLPSFMRSLMDAGNCHFSVERRIPQRSPITSEKRKLKMVGSGKTIPDKDESEIGLPARRILGNDRNARILVIDDLEGDRVDKRQDVFARYRNALDTIIPEEMRDRAAVHFFVNMIEAYYFAHASAINAVLKTNLEDWDGDVELIPHPKGKLKSLFAGFDEKSHGAEIVQNLDLPKVLSNRETCASLRALFAWCVRATGNTAETRFCLADGKIDDTTGKQQTPSN